MFPVGAPTGMLPQLQLSIHRCNMSSIDSTTPIWKIEIWTSPYSVRCTASWYLVAGWYLTQEVYGWNTRILVALKANGQISSKSTVITCRH